MENNEYEVLQVQHDQNIVQLDAVERANVDSQVATAKQYPRNVTRSINNSIAMATMDENTAQSCGYALPRGNKYGEDATLSPSEQEMHQKSLDEARLRLRHELKRAEASEQQQRAVEDLARENALSEQSRKEIARDNYADRGRSEMLSSGDVSIDAKIVSEWAKGQSLRGGEMDPKMQEEIRKRFPATSAAQAMHGWSSGQDLRQKREEARRVLKERRAQQREQQKEED